MEDFGKKTGAVGGCVFASLAVLGGIVAVVVYFGLQLLALTGGDSSGVGSLEMVASGQVVVTAELIEIVDQDIPAGGSHRVAIIEIHAIDVPKLESGSALPALAVGDRVRSIILDAVDLDVGTEYGFFLGSHPSSPFSSLYIHDLGNDSPVDGFPQWKGTNGRRPLEVLDCMVELIQPNDGPPRYRALATSVERHAGGPDFPTELRTCASETGG